MVINLVTLSDIVLVQKPLVIEEDDRRHFDVAKFLDRFPYFHGRNYRHIFHRRYL
jgi:hypothetical protein